MSDVDETGNSYFGSTLDFEVLGKGRSFPKNQKTWELEDVFPLLGPPWRINLGGGFTCFFMFIPYLGKIPILTNVFQMG